MKEKKVLSQDYDKDKTVISCTTCTHARKACAKDKIACGFLSGIKHGVRDLPVSYCSNCGFSNTQNFTYCPECGEKICNDFYDFLEYEVNFKNKEAVYEGWAKLGCPPFNDNSSMMTNNCVIVDVDNCCNYYKK